ncbi:MAG TPA: hypothetical protein DCE44_25405 [Verrucomicrobiales bacterium]|nr:hypothetical protein [Verrucomicrobiales bacterium]
MRLLRLFSPLLRRIHSILCVLLAILWVPLTAHCEVSELLGVGVEHSQDCSEHSGSTPAGGCDHCSLCQVVDGGLVISSGLHLNLKPALLPVFDISRGEVVEVFVGAPEFLPSPPRRDERAPSAWRFLLRTALSPRAPSCVS